MDRALLLLLCLHLKAWGRRVLRSALSWRGAIFALIAIGFVGLVIFGANAQRGSGDAVLSTGEGRPFSRYSPLGLFAFTMLSVFSGSRHRGVYFNAAEIDLLFAAPFGRRQLLTYRLLHQLLLNTLSVTFMTLFLSPYFESLPRAWFALLLTFTFLTLAQQSTSLLFASLAERLRRLGRRAIALLLAAGLVAGVWLGSTAMREPQLAVDRLRAFLESTPVEYALFPFRVFTEVVGAPDTRSFLAWGAGAMIVLGALYALVLLLDVDYRDSAVETSRRIHERLRKARGGRLTSSSSRKLRLALPVFPRLGGAGTIAWRQAQELVRESPAALYVAIVFGLGMLLPIAVGIGPGPTSGMSGAALTVLQLTIVLPLFLSNWFQYDFRGDLERLESLKLLPLSPFSIALGQLFTPTAILTLIQAAGLLLTLALATTPGVRLVAISGLALCPLANLLLVSIDNFLFLNYPTRSVPNAPGDFQTVGRMMMSMFVKFLLVGAVAALGVTIFTTVHSVLGHVLPALLAVAILSVGVVGLALALVGRAFARFDLSRLPPE